MSEINIAKFAKKNLKISSLTSDEFEAFINYLGSPECIIENLNLEDFKIKKNILQNESLSDVQMNILMTVFSFNKSVKNIDLTNVPLSLDAIESLKKVLLGGEEFEPNTTLENIILDKEKLGASDYKELNKNKDKPEKIKELYKLPNRIDRNYHDIMELLKINREDVEERNKLAGIKPEENIRRHSEPKFKTVEPKKEKSRRKSEPKINLGSEKKHRTIFEKRQEANAKRNEAIKQAITPMLKEIKNKEKEQRRSEELTRNSPNSKKPV